MSTRSYICAKQPDGTYKGVYCHYDGYLEYNGAMLLDFYPTKEDADKILQLGSLSTLKENWSRIRERNTRLKIDNQT